MSRAFATSKGSGDRIEHEVIQRLPVEYVGDGTAEWYDARVTSPIDHEVAPLASVLVVGVGTPVEIKAARVRTGSQRGRFYIRQKQHRRLLDAGGYYALAVYAPVRDLCSDPVRALLVIPASIVDEFIPSWITPGGEAADRATYSQLAWSRVIDPEDVDERRGSA